MEKDKTYKCTLFTTEVIKDAAELFIKLTKEDESLQDEEPSYHLNISLKDENWVHDNIDEFFADYIKYPNNARFSLYLKSFTFIKFSE